MQGEIQGNLTSDKIRQLVDKGTVVMTGRTEHTPARKAIDGPVIGNGDVGVAVRTEENGYTFLLGKNDFWRQPYLYETKKARREKLLGENCRRTGGRLLPVGWMRLKFAGIQQETFSMVQNIYEARVEITARSDHGEIVLNTWVANSSNVLVVEIKSHSKEKVLVDVSLMPGEYDIYEVDGYEDGYAGNIVWFQYGAEPYRVKGRRIVAVAAGCSKELFLDYGRMSKKGGSFWIEPGESVCMLLSLFSNLDAQEPLTAAFDETKKSLQHIEELYQEHLFWWKGFWEKSAVETGSEILDSYYYSSLYWLGCCTGEGKVPPAIFGPFTTSNLAFWSGAYTLNYNFESPFFALYTSNRQNLITSYIDPLLDSIPIGKMYAKEKFGRKGICLPVEIGPWGMVCSGNFFGQKTNAAYCCVNIFMHYFSTYDEVWGRKAYPFVREVVRFWEEDLVLEEGIYHVMGDSAHEEVTGEGEKDNIHALGLVKMLFTGIIKMGEELREKKETLRRWENIAENLAPFPTGIRNGKPVYLYNNDSYEWRDSNGTPVKFIYPFGCIGLDSEKEAVERAKNTLEQKEYLFYNMNAYCEYVQMRARVNCDPQKTYQIMEEACVKLSYPNRYMIAHGGGIEDFSAIPAGINEMMMQSHESVIRVFPSWPKGKNAWFFKLRAYEAFLVSSRIEENRVQYIEIVSEKGKQLVLESPWKITKIAVNGIRKENWEGPRIIIDTVAGDKVLFEEGERYAKQILAE